MDGRIFIYVLNIIHDCLSDIYSFVMPLFSSHPFVNAANISELFICVKVVKITDFGLARFQHMGGVMTAETGTYRWMAPEVQITIYLQII